MIHYSRQELVTAILNYNGEDMYNNEDILSLAVAKDYELYRYIENIAIELNISVAKFINQHYNYEVYRSLHTEA
jgi:hypothetical protein